MNCFCIAEKYHPSIKTALRFLILTLCIGTSIASVGYSSQFRSVVIYQATYTNSLPCFVVYILTLLPDACHDSAKLYVKLVSFSLGILSGTMLFMQENDFGIGFSIIIGSFYAGLYWVTVLFLCTKEIRQALLRSSPCVSKYCFADEHIV